MEKRVVQLLAYLYSLTFEFEMTDSLNHSGDFHFQLRPVIFSDLWYDQGREENNIYYY